MMPKYIKTGLFLVFAALFGCSGGGDSSEPEVILNPEAVLLISPLKNEACNKGVILSTTESNVDFEWNVSKNTNSYTLVLTNLETGISTEANTSSNKTTLPLLRGIAYSWHIISKSNKTATTATSETWKFFNSGVAKENYAPYPADLISPTMGSTVSSPVTLSWSGSDIDNDIASYDVYLGTVSPPTALQSNTSNSSISNLSLMANTIYYWRVITKDKFGNNSQSPIFQFRTK